MDALVALGSVLGGALLGGVARALEHRYSMHVEGRGVARALRAEVAGLLGLVDRRGQPAMLEAIITRLRRPEHVVTSEDFFAVRATQDYFTVFRAITARLSLLGDLADQIVLWYALARAVVEEMNELRERRDKFADGRIKVSREELLTIHEAFAALLATTLDEGRPLLATLDRRIRQRWLGVLR